MSSQLDKIRRLEDDLIACGLRYRLTGQAVLLLYRYYLRAYARFLIGAPGERLR